ncbi:MAG TPA: beta-N-acetylhexosaminidase [Microbacterium sp.]|uniref:family 20 glycosylhydrolase n=1 Tax=Microbacterium sp. UBA1097 TaxID=1946941 RepID=UPI000E85721A|nr:family 20 glycosylhydrolase [Microbacterium sp. UBA1097]HBS10049.1 beta-N-acetylhexosaminidase [Microbacterium sp.]HBU43727.1 beta-N-acetylhexosaminidase [Microbacterium sp.]|tara:strand:- start:117 stop:1673 length:1557 start_codon:yes stop_codon:yes gene_type:complete
MTGTQPRDAAAFPWPVPLPRDAAAVEGPGFTLQARTAVTGDQTVIGILTKLVSARTDGEINLDSTATGPGISLVITDAETPESYRLNASADGVEVIGSDAAGLFYGIQTLAQLIERTPDGWRIPAVEVADAPRFAYRGVMVDVARHFFPVEVVLGVIDRAAQLKLNHLHLHLTDDQGWRIEIPSRPELTRFASGTAIGGDSGGFYTAEDYARIVAYAAARHMTVVPEIDLPGHTHAVGLAYPDIVEPPVLSEHIREVVEAYGSTLPVAGEPYEGIAVGFSSLRIGDPATETFVTDVAADLAAITPGPYLHVGGDEALGTDPADYAAFVSLASRIVADAGKVPVMWHEAGAASDLHPGSVGQYWGFVSPTDGMDEKARGFVARGGRVILSPADAVYLDMKDSADSELGLTWANGVTSVERAYAWEPGAVLDGVAESDILGVEAPLWTETVRTAADIDALMFPRIAAAAEAAWSPATGEHPLRSWESFRERVGALDGLWSALGIRFRRSPEIPWSGEGAS